mmetsp:Transcript_51235/g.141807  ORF Transcript_51235/g.141807 Transcript_51235/m.141807 type:complete len:200 (-) Transcript_51235:311-910(-)
MLPVPAVTREAQRGQAQGGGAAAAPRGRERQCGRAQTKFHQSAEGVEEAHALPVLPDARDPHQRVRPHAVRQGDLPQALLPRLQPEQVAPRAWRAGRGAVRRQGGQAAQPKQLRRQQRRQRVPRPLEHRALVQPGPVVLQPRGAAQLARWRRRAPHRGLNSLWHGPRHSGWRGSAPRCPPDLQPRRHAAARAQYRLING